MQEQTARSVLRLIAVSMMLVGVMLVTIAVINMVGVRSSVPQGATVTFQRMGALSILGQFSIIGWGAVLYAASVPLAKKVVG